MDGSERGAGRRRDKMSALHGGECSELAESRK